MKLIFAFLCLFIGVYTLIAQPCVNNSTTVPVTSPSNDWKVNKFNWYTPANDSYKLSPLRYTTQSNEINLPYFGYTQHSYLKKLAAFKPLGGENPGVRYPEDGWELIKQDFGFYYNDNSGTENRTLRVSSIPYLILYNKYSGILRVMGYAPNEGKNFIKVTLSLDERYKDSQNKIIASGLLRTYSKTAIPALDKETEIVSVSSYARNLDSDDSKEMFYSDFQTYYDPCTCQFETGLTVSFKASQQGTFSAIGINNMDLSNADNPKFLASLWETKTDEINNNGNGDSFKESIQGGSVHFVTNQDMEDKLKDLADQVGATQETKDDLGNVAEAVGTFAEVAGILVAVANPAAGAALGAFAVIANFAGGKLGEEGATATPSISALSGIVTFDSESTDIDIANPGSKSATSSATLSSQTFNYEYAEQNGTSGGYGAPVYPMYNEILGVYSLLKTPTVSVYDQSVSAERDPNCAYLCYKSSGHRDIAFNFSPNSDNFKYILNPALSKRKVKILSALKITRSTLAENTEFETDNLGSVYYLKKVSEKIVAGSGSYTIKDVTYVTPFIDISEIGSISPKFHYDSYNYCGDVSIDCTGNHDIFKAELVLQVFLEFDQKMKNSDKYNTSFFCFTHPLTQVSTVNNPSDNNLYNPDGYNVNGGIPENLLVTDKHFTQNTTIYAWNTISITGNISTDPNVRVKFMANRVQADYSCEMTGEVEMGYESPVSNPVTVQPVTFDQTSLASYCGGSNTVFKYEAKKSNATAAKLEAKATKGDNTASKNLFSKILAYPNPTNGIIKLKVLLEKAGFTTIEITDLTGRSVQKVIANYWLKSGLNEFEADLADLPEGMYLLHISSGDYSDIQKISLGK